MCREIADKHESYMFEARKGVQSYIIQFNWLTHSSDSLFPGVLEDKMNYNRTKV